MSLSEEQQLELDRRFLGLARFIAGWSRDTSRKVGAVIVRDYALVVSTGFNEFAPGVQNKPERRQRPAKYLFTGHAEQDAILAAGYNGANIIGTTMYLPWYPCAQCAWAIIKSGIRELVCGQEPDFSDPQWGPGFRSAVEQLEEAQINVRFVFE